MAALIGVAVIIPGLGSGQIYHWADEKGVQYYTTDFDSIPQAYRPVARSLPVAPPPELPVISPPETVTRIPILPGSPILVSARINGTGSVTLILDTGSDHTLVTPSVLRRLGVSAESPQRGVIKGVTGTSYVDAVWVDSLEVGDARVGPLLVIAHDADLKGADGLLGRDFLANFSVTIDSVNRVVTLTPH